MNHENIKGNKIATKDIHDVGYKTLFSDDKYLMYIHKKSHSISRAVYLITDFFDSNEPIKTKMRQIATQLVEQVLSLSVESSPSRKSLLDSVIKSGLSIISYSEIAMFSGVESEMNHSILSSEIENLLSVIEIREVPSRLGRRFVLDDSMLIKDNYHAPQHASNRRERNTNNLSNKIIARDNTDAKKIDRREAILSIIRAKGQSSIKDITDTITDCSEKTIQRELIDMVTANILKKDGERRWTRYSVLQ